MVKNLFEMLWNLVNQKTCSTLFPYKLVGQRSRKDCFVFLLGEHPRLYHFRKVWQCPMAQCMWCRGTSPEGSLVWFPFPIASAFQTYHLSIIRASDVSNIVFIQRMVAAGNQKASSVDSITCSRKIKTNHSCPGWHRLRRTGFGGNL